MKSYTDNECTSEAQVTLSALPLCRKMKQLASGRMEQQHKNGEWRGEAEYRELCALMGNPYGIPKMLLCDLLVSEVFRHVTLDAKLLAEYYKRKFGWDWMADDDRSLLDFTREKFGDRAVEIINKL